MTVSRWIQFQETREIFWDLPIIGAAQKRLGINGLQKKDYEIFGHISIKLQVIASLIVRVEREHSNVHQIVLSNYKNDNLSNKDEEGYALNIANELKYEFISDIESFLLQIWSCWELTKKLIAKLNELLGVDLNEKQVIDFIKGFQSKKNLHNDWFEILRSHRNFITHSGSGYIAIDASNENPSKWDFLILKYNIKKFDDNNDFFHYSDLIKINNGFVEIMDLIKISLIEMFDHHNLDG